VDHARVVSDGTRDIDSLTSWRSNWAELRVAVLGLGASGFSVADTLVELGADVFVLAEAASLERVQLIEVIGARYAEGDLSVVPTELAEFDPELVIVSPGIPNDHPLVTWARDAGTAVWGDIELAWRVRDKVEPAAEWMLVTGASGSETTAALATHILELDGRHAATVGFGSVPVVDAVRYPAGFDAFFVVLSTAQLDWLGSTPNGIPVPWGSVCLGVEANPSAEDVDAAARVYRNTKIAALYNRDDLETQTMLENAEVTEGCRAIGFSLGSPGPSDLGVVDGILCDRAFLEERATTALEIATLDDLLGPGLAFPAGVSVVLAASALARSLGVNPAVVREGIRTFRPQTP
jgi:UDP-N-acetylmuramoylalanine--D-glutamate ligase